MEPDYKGTKGQFVYQKNLNVKSIVRALEWVHLYDNLRTFWFLEIRQSVVVLMTQLAQKSPTYTFIGYKLLVGNRTSRNRIMKGLNVL